MTARIAERVRTADERDQQRRVMLVVGLAIAAFLLFFPAKQLVSEKLRISRLEGRVTALTEENERLATESGRLKDAKELELVARDRLGLVKPGERAYLLVPQPTPAPAEQPAGASVWSRVWSWLTALVRGHR